ncbi:MAG: LLM class flavin-dependent oxidoreductase [Candidatus Binatia bacterium]
MGKIGLCFVNPAPQIQPGYVTTMAKRCEEIGLHSFWVIDRIAYDNLEPLTLLAAAAAVTNRIRLGTSVLLAGLRHPTLLAKTVGTLDFLSGGRITLGVGFGSRENDFTAVEVPFQGRGSRAEEAMKLMKRLWTEDGVTHQGKFFKVENLTIGPRPAQSPHPPVWTGGGADVALRRAARLADGYICGSTAIQEFPSVWEKISRFASAAGRNPGEIEKAGLTFMAIDENRGRAVDACAAYLNRYYGRGRIDVDKHFLVGPPGACAERLSSFFLKGLDTLIIGTVTADPKQLDLFGEKVLPLIKV